MRQSVNYLWKTAVMPVVFLPTFVADTKLTFNYNFVATLKVFWLIYVHIILCT